MWKRGKPFRELGVPRIGSRDTAQMFEIGCFEVLG